MGWTPFWRINLFHNCESIVQNFNVCSVKKRHQAQWCITSGFGIVFYGTDVTIKWQQSKIQYSVSWSRIFHSIVLSGTCSPGIYWVLSWECSRPECGIIWSAINRWSDCICLDRDSCHLDTLSHTMKPSDPLLRADDTLHYWMYTAGKMTCSKFCSKIDSPHYEPLWMRSTENQVEKKGGINKEQPLNTLHPA